MNKKYAPQTIKVKEINRELYQIRFVLSTPAVDRQGEVINQNGWDLTNYLKNPVVLWAHDQSIPAIGKMVEIGMVDGNLEGLVQFAYEENEDARKIFELCAGEYINAGSVGFMNRKWMYDEINDVLTLLENELYEFSIVNVPANADALAKAKSKGLDVEVVDRLNKKHDENRFKDLGIKVDEKGESEVIEKKEGDECEMPDGSMGEMHPNDNGEMVCMSKNQKSEDVTNEEVKNAIEVLFKAIEKEDAEKVDIIKGCFKEMTSRLNSTQADKKDSKVDATPQDEARRKRYSHRHVNKLIRRLITSK